VKLIKVMNAGQEIKNLNFHMLQNIKVEKRKKRKKNKKKLMLEM
jgi:hypothetical protein